MLVIVPGGAGIYSPQEIAQWTLRFAVNLTCIGFSVSFLEVILSLFLIFWFVHRDI